MKANCIRDSSSASHSIYLSLGSHASRVIAMRLQEGVDFSKQVPIAPDEYVPAHWIRHQACARHAGGDVTRGCKRSEAVVFKRNGQRWNAYVVKRHRRWIAGKPRIIE